ncbi:MAG: hypothetical protein ACSHX8_05715 [Opitutaceae bacterium]
MSQVIDICISDGIDGIEEVTITVDKDLALDGRLFGRLQVIR